MSLEVRWVLGGDCLAIFPQIKPAKTNLSLFGRSVNAVQVEHMRASGLWVRQGDVKQAGADLLVAPVKLNVRLPCPEPVQPEQLRRL